MTLDKLKTGECGRIISVRGEGELRHHLLDMGLTPGTEVSLRKTAPMGDPVQLVLRGYELTLRLAEAAKIEIVSIESMTETKKENERHQRLLILVWENLERLEIIARTGSVIRFPKGNRSRLHWQVIRTVERQLFLIS